MIFSSRPRPSVILFFLLTAAIAAAPTLAEEAKEGELKPLIKIFGQMGNPHNGLNPELFGKDSNLWFDHNAGYMVPKKLYYDAHPEYYAMRSNGQRIPKTTSDAYIHLCMSNPDVLRISTERVLGWIRLQKDKRFFGVAPGDGHDWCQCDKCKAMDVAPGNHSDRLLKFTNHIARAVAKEFPDKVLYVFAYCGTELPPVQERPEKNVLVLYCPYYGNALSMVHPLTHPANAEALAQLEGWLKVAPDNVGIYDYNMYYVLSWDAMAEKIKWYSSKGIKYIRFCGIPLCFRQMFDETVVNRMVADPNQDYEKLKVDFVESHYGPAAPFVLEYLTMVKERLAKGYPRGIHEWFMPAGYYLDDLFIAKSLAVFEKMKKAAAEDARLLAEIENERSMMLDDFLASVDYRTVKERYPKAKDVTLSVAKEKAFKTGPKDDPQQRLRAFLRRFAGVAAPKDADAVELAREFFQKPDEVVAKYPAPSYKTKPEKLASGVRLPATAFEGGHLYPDYSWFCQKRTGMAVKAAKGPDATSMRAEFTLDSAPAGAATLKIEGQDSTSDLPPGALITITLNGVKVAEGPCGFARRGWSWKTYRLDKGVLKEGKNVLEIVNTTPSARLDAFWFMLSEARIDY